MNSKTFADVILVTDIHPNKFWTRTVGVYRLATELRMQGLQVEVLYGFTDFSTEEVQNILLNWIGPNTKFIGYSNTFIEQIPISQMNSSDVRSQNQNSFTDALPSVRKKWPDLKIILGGASAAFLKENFADLYIVGYSDRLIIDLANDFSSWKNRRHIIRKNKILVYSDETECPEEFQTQYEKSDLIYPGECLTIELTRGCRFRCKFCSFPLNGRTKGNYYKKPESLFNELLRNYEQHGTTNYILADDTFNESDEKLSYFLDVFERLPFQIQYSAFFRIDLLMRQQEFFERFLKSGLRGAFFGIESLHDLSAQAIGKMFHREQIISFLKTLRANWGQEVVTSGGFILGLPHETQETAKSWLNELKNPEFPLHNHYVQPLFITSSKSLTPWTSEFQKHYEKYGYELYFDQNAQQTKWKNQFWDFDHVQTLAREHNQYVQQQTNFDCFTHTIIMGYGLSHNQAFHLQQLSVKDNRLLNNLTKERIHIYRQNLLRNLKPSEFALDNIDQQL